jgi:hypothetical protein
MRNFSVLLHVLQLLPTKITFLWGIGLSAPTAAAALEMRLLNFRSFYR